MKTPTSLRERKKQRTRDAIVQAAMELFDQRGFDGTTIEEIAAMADVSRRTFFRYFATKEMVMFPHQTPYVDRFRVLLADAANHETPFGVLRRACLEMAGSYMAARHEHLRQQRIIQRSRTLIARGNELDTEWENTIAEALAARLGPERAGRRRARLIAGATLGVIRATLQEWYDSDCNHDLVDLGREAFALLANGVNGAPNASEPPAAAPKRDARK